MTLELVSLFFAGLLAGEEVVVRFGVRGPLGAMDPQPQILFRQRLIRTLRLLVPGIFLPTAVLAIIVTVMHGDVARMVALAALLVWALVTFLGTVPINKAALEWRPDAPPANWRVLTRRWELLDTVRCWAAVIAFALLLAALA
jgi:Domain of unknown function (DUF1772)